MGIRNTAIITIATIGLFLLTSCSISFQAPSTNSSSGQGITAPVKVVQGPSHATIVLLPVTIHGKGPFIFELDTGASTSLIAPSLVQQFNLSQTGHAQKISGIGGVQQGAPVSISNWNIGSIRLPSATIYSASMPLERGSSIDGLVGSDIWSRFGKFTLDYNSGTLTVYKQIALSAPMRSEQRFLAFLDSRSAYVGEVAAM
jgi:hypothetical protein